MSEDNEFKLSNKCLSHFAKRYSIKDILPDYLPQSSYPSYKEKSADPNRIVNVDILAKINADIHYTSNYYLMHKDPPRLVVRRGMQFSIMVQFNRILYKESDSIFIQITKSDKKNSNYIVSAPYRATNPEDTSEPWVAITSRINKQGRSAEITMTPTVNCDIGKYHFSFFMLWNDEDQSIAYEHNEPIFVIFNPWFHQGPVFLPNSNNKEEYVLSELGSIFRGNVDRIYYTNWKFSQFDEEVLEATLALAEIGKVEDWSSVVDIVHSIANSVESPNGIIEGNWSGNYEGGTHPMNWTGTREIINQWYETNKPVKYGQCYVFSAFLAGVFRSLGIPSRIVTCLNCSTHSDENYTTDFVYSENLDMRKSLNFDGETYWCYLVWCEVWINRADLGHGKAHSWNAVYSKGGPCSLISIKQKSLKETFDTEMFYSFTNSNIFNWHYEEGKPIKLTSLDLTRIGISLYTKKVQSFSKEDITNTYRDLGKIPSPERKMIELASKKKNPIFHNFIDCTQTKDIKVICRANSVKYGTPMRVVGSIMNKGKNDEVIRCYIQIVSFKYNGHPSALVKNFSNEFQMNSRSSHDETVNVEFDDYLKHIVDEECFFKAYFLVKCSNNDYMDYTEFSVIPPQLKFQVTPTNPQVNNLASIKVAIRNHGQKDLTGHFSIGEMDSNNVLELPTITIKQNEHAFGVFNMKPKYPGKYALILKFIGQITTSSSLIMFVKEANK